MFDHANHINEYTIHYKLWGCNPPALFEEEFDESKHPRADDGKFATKEGGEGETEKKPSLIIPQNVAGSKKVYKSEDGESIGIQTQRGYGDFYRETEEKLKELGYGKPSKQDKKGKKGVLWFPMGKAEELLDILGEKKEYDTQEYKEEKSKREKAKKKELSEKYKKELKEAVDGKQYGTVSLEADGNNIRLRMPYNEYNIQEVKSKFGAKWEPDKKSWKISGDYKDKLISHLENKQQKANEWLDKKNKAVENNWILKGSETYENKEAIKEAGGMWDSINKRWLMPNQESYDKIKNHISEEQNKKSQSAREKTEQEEKERKRKAFGDYGDSDIDESGNKRFNEHGRLYSDQSIKKPKSEHIEKEQQILKDIGKIEVLTKRPIVKDYGSDDDRIDMAKEERQALAQWHEDNPPEKRDKLVDDMLSKATKTAEKYEDIKPELAYYKSDTLKAIKEEIYKVLKSVENEKYGYYGSAYPEEQTMSKEQKKKYDYIQTINNEIHDKLTKRKEKYGVVSRTPEDKPDNRTTAQKHKDYMPEEYVDPGDPGDFAGFSEYIGSLPVFINTINTQKNKRMPLKPASLKENFDESKHKRDDSGKFATKGKIPFLPGDRDKAKSKWEDRQKSVKRMEMDDKKKLSKDSMFAKRKQRVMDMEKRDKDKGDTRKPPNVGGGVKQRIVDLWYRMFNMYDEQKLYDETKKYLDATVGKKQYGGDKGFAFLPEYDIQKGIELKPGYKVSKRGNIVKKGANMSELEQSIHYALFGESFDESKHPRGGIKDNPGQFSKGSGTAPASAETNKQNIIQSMKQQREAADPRQVKSKKEMATAEGRKQKPQAPNYGENNKKMEMKQQPTNQVSGMRKEGIKGNGLSDKKQVVSANTPKKTMEADSKEGWYSKLDKKANEFYDKMSSNLKDKIKTNAQEFHKNMESSFWKIKDDIKGRIKAPEIVHDSIALAGAFMKTSGASDTIKDVMGIAKSGIEKFKKWRENNKNYNNMTKQQKQGALQDAIHKEAEQHISGNGGNVDENELNKIIQNPDYVPSWWPGEGSAKKRFEDLSPQQQAIYNDYQKNRGEVKLTYEQLSKVKEPQEILGAGGKKYKQTKQQRSDIAPMYKKIKFRGKKYLAKLNKKGDGYNFVDPKIRAMFSEKIMEFAKFTEKHDESKHPRDGDGKFTNKNSGQKNKTLNLRNQTNKKDVSKKGSSAPSNSPKKTIMKKMVDKAQGIVDKMKLSEPLKKAGYSEKVANNIALTAAVLFVAPNFPGVSFALGGAAYGVPLVAGHIKKRIDSLVEGHIKQNKKAKFEENFDESKHKRDEDGKFAKKEGTSTTEREIEQAKEAENEEIEVREADDERELNFLDNELMAYSPAKENEELFADYTDDLWSEINTYIEYRDNGGEDIDEIMEERIEKMDDDFERTEQFDEPIRVFRGIEGMNSEQFIEGENIRMVSYQSSTISKDVAGRFLGGYYVDIEDQETWGMGDSGVLLAITTKRGLYLEGVTRTRGEYEVLLPRNRKYKIDKKEGKLIYLTMEEE